MKPVVYPPAVQAELEKATAFFKAYINRLSPRTDTAGFRIRTRVREGMEDLKAGRGPIHIAIVGDSISHGGFGGYGVGNDYDAVYHNRLRLMIAHAYPTVPVNILNMAVGGVSAPFGAKIFAGQVVPHKPDLVIVCFGLNDINAPLGRYETALAEIFGQCKTAGFDCVFMTPNMLNTYRAPGTEERYFSYAETTAEVQNSGKMDTYIQAGRDIANRHGVPVCDAYAAWRAMQEAGIDTTLLLSNSINHPLGEMHMLFAALLFHTVFGTAHCGEVGTAESTMTESAKK